MAFGALYHLSESLLDKQRSALHNIHNLMAEMPDVPIELVVQGEAINMAVAKTSVLAEEIRELQQNGLLVTVCHHTMLAKKVHESYLLPDKTIVPSAVGRLVRRQQEKFSYVKP
jgi:intracellular sulfur oxidation DsrE/DsrF family protein